MLAAHLLSFALTRPFSFVPYGSSVATTSPAQPTISCDGKVPGSTMDCTHWTDNTTPDALYADTSTEIALNLARARLNGEYSEYDSATVVNNHYDSDGVLSVWACMQPEAALSHSELLVAGAEAGDFGEWSTNAGVKLDFALSSLCAADDATAYGTALSRLPALLAELEGGGGQSDLWEGGWEQVLEDWASIEAGDVSVEACASSRIALVKQSHASRRLSSAALHRRLAELGLAGGQPAACQRVLRCVREGGGGGRWRYEYEKPGHGWVKRLVSRATVPPVSDGLAARLNSHPIGGGGADNAGRGPWVEGGRGGLVAICYTSGWVETPPDVMAQALLAEDEGAR